MEPGDTSRKIDSNDQLIFDSSNRLVGIRSGKSDSRDFRVGAAAQAAIDPLVSGASILVLASGDTTGATDAAAVNAAISAVNLLTSGGTVTLGAGQWYVNTAFKNKSNVAVRGVSKYATKVKMVATSAAQRTALGSAWNIFYVGTEFGETSVTNWSITDMTLDFDRNNQGQALIDNMIAASDAVGNGIRTNGNVTNGVVARCRLINAVSHGLIGVQGLYDFQMYENECYGSTYRGIHLHGDSGVGGYDTASAQGRISVHHNTIHENGLLVTGAVQQNAAALTTGLFCVFANQQQVDVSYNTVYREAGCGIQLTGDTLGTPITDARQIQAIGNKVRYCGFGFYINNGLREVVVANNIVAECGVAVSGMVYSTGAYGVGIYVSGPTTNDDMPVNITITGNIVSRCQNAGLASNGWGKGSTTNARAGVVTGNIFVANGGNSMGGFTPLGSQVSLEHTHRLSFSSNTYDGTTPGTMVAWNVTNTCDSIQVLGCVAMRSAGNTALNCDAPNSNIQPGNELLGHVAQSALPDTTYFFSSTPQQYKQTYTVTNDSVAWFKNTQLGSVNFVKGIRTMLLSAAGVVSNTSVLSSGFDGQSVTLINTSANSITLTGGGTTLVASIVLSTQGAKYTMTYSSTIGKWS